MATDRWSGPFVPVLVSAAVVALAGGGACTGASSNGGDPDGGSGGRTGGSGGRMGGGGTGGSSSGGRSGGATGGANGSGGRSGGGSGGTTVSGPGPSVEGCPVFPADNAWNRDVSGDPVDPNSANYIASIGPSTGLHADFGAEFGIPFVAVPGDQPKVPITFDYDDESDPGPYPIPADIPIEGGGDAHGLIIDRATCFLYEVYVLERVSAGVWHGGSGAIWHLRENWTRPDGWTSADAAGLPIFPGLARYEEVAAGEIRHALRFTVNNTQKAYVAPATHYASSSTDPNRPPMGLRVRLKASVDISGYGPQLRIILTALKKYGLILADNGSNWFITGAPNPGWDDDDITAIRNVHGSDFEVVQLGPITR
jgi:hypothetical protein